jgi:hypothetical protein
MIEVLAAAQRRSDAGKELACLATSRALCYDLLAIY